MRLNTPGESEISKDVEEAALKRDEDIQKIKESKESKTNIYLINKYIWVL